MRLLLSVMAALLYTLTSTAAQPLVHTSKTKSSGFLPTVKRSTFADGLHLPAPGSAAKILAMTDLMRQTQSQVLIPNAAYLHTKGSKHHLHHHGQEKRKRRQAQGAVAADSKEAEAGVEAVHLRREVVPSTSPTDQQQRPAFNPDTVGEDDYQHTQRFKASFLDGYYSSKKEIVRGTGWPEDNRG